jgi:protein-arginine kinase activator protein McsA
MSDVFEGGSVFPKVITYYYMVSKYPESMMKKTMKKTCPDEGLRCSFCGKLSLALTDVHDYQRSADMRVCESCARNMLESVMAEKKRADPAPPPVLDFNRENVTTVLHAAAHALATAASLECEQLVGDVVFGGGTLAQRRIAERFETIQLYWYQRAVLASIASEARAEKYDDVPHLVSYANEVISAQNLAEFQRVMTAHGGSEDYYVRAAARVKAEIKALMNSQFGVVRADEGP